MNRNRFGAKLVVTMAVPAILTLAACASTEVRRDFDPKVSFAGLETYAVMVGTPGPGTDPALGSPLLQRRIRDAVERELEMKGFLKAMAGVPDFEIAIHVVTEERLSVETLDRYGWDYYGYRRFGHPFYFGYVGPRSFTRTFVREYLEGTIILDVVHSGRDELIWRGWASKALARDPKPERVDEYASKAVGKILEGFPPSAS